MSTPVRVDVGDGFEAVIDQEDAPRIEGKVFRRQKLDGQHVAIEHNSGEILDRLLLDCPDYLFVIHRNGNGLDCRRCNMLTATGEQREMWSAAPKDGPSRFKGVAPLNGSGKFTAHILRKGKPLKLGEYASERLAALAYDEAARRSFGKYARLNFPAPDGSEGIAAWTE